MFNKSVKLDNQINIEQYIVIIYSLIIVQIDKKREKRNEFASLSNDTKRGQTTVYLMEM